MKVGIFGGTFDPIHKAHLLAAEGVQRSLGLHEVLFIPTGEPWMKSGKPVSPCHHRLNMTCLAIEPHPDFRVSSMEIDRPGPSYTVDTLEVLHEGGDPGTDYYMIVGMDALHTLPRWKEPARILELCTLVVIPRPGVGGYDINALENISPGASQAVIMLEDPMLDGSSSSIRRRIPEGLDVADQLPPMVISYIDQHGLYKDRR